MTSNWFGIVAVFFTLLLVGPSVAHAQVLGTCSGTCACTTTEVDDYGNCTIITESSMMDTLDPSDVANKTGLSATLVSGKVHISANISEPSGVVIPVNGYNGDWPDLGALHAYLEDLYGITPPELPE